MRLVALVRTCTKEYPPAASLEAFTAQYIAPANPGHRAALQAPVPPLVSIYKQSPSSSSCSELLTKSRQVAQVTASCLAYFRGRCLVCRPHHSVNHTDSYAHSPKPWRERFPTVPYKPLDVGPPSWVEEQRVARALWRLQLLLELKRASADGRLSAWADPDTARIQTMGIEDLFGGWHGQLEELLTIDHVLGLLDFNEVLKEQGIADPWPDEAMPPLDGDDSDRNHWSWATHLVFSAPGYTDLRHMISHIRSPIRGAPWRPFRELGLTILNKEKLMRLELAPRIADSPPPGAHPLHWFMGNQYVTWRSLLPPAVLNSVEAALEEELHLTMQNDIL